MTSMDWFGPSGSARRVQAILTYPGWRTFERRSRIWQVAGLERVS
jgi:hypothetical protein